MNELLSKTLYAIQHLFTPDPIYVQAFAAGAEQFKDAEITTPMRMAHFVAQASVETGGFTAMRENMNYSAPRILEVFGEGKHSAKVKFEEAKALEHNPEALAERVYGTGNPNKARMLGNTKPGDGFKFRGNGMLQTTGRFNHRVQGQKCGVDFENNPELMCTPENILKPALAFWKANNLGLYADLDNAVRITEKINGGQMGLEHRRDVANTLIAMLS